MARLVLPSVLVAGCGGNGEGGDGTGATGGTATTATAGTASGGVTAGSAATGGSTSASTSSGTTGGPGGSSATSAGTAGTGEGACGNAPGQLMHPDLPWNTPVDGAPVAADSNDVIAYLEANVGGNARFQIDFSLTILEADADTPFVPFTPTADHYSPDCDTAPIPVPDGGHIEGESGYVCEGGGDCHLIVVDEASCRLYEQWRANVPALDQASGGCLAVWDLSAPYDETLRGDYCTSADAAGLPIAPLLATADEVAAGEIRHALRFIVPNAHIRADRYVRPATHSTPATSGPDQAPPYGARLRLKADVDTSSLPPAAQVVAEAMKRYGIILADAGNITFTFASDDFSATTWDAVGLGPHDLKALAWSDFEVVDAGADIVWSDGSCSRRPITR